MKEYYNGIEHNLTHIDNMNLRIKYEDEFRMFAPLDVKPLQEMDYIFSFNNQTPPEKLCRTYNTINYELYRNQGETPIIALEILKINTF
jgi:hypothetical protein